VSIGIRPRRVQPRRRGWDEVQSNNRRATDVAGVPIGSAVLCDGLIVVVARSEAPRQANGPGSIARSRHNGSEKWWDESRNAPRNGCACINAGIYDNFRLLHERTKRLREERLARERHNYLLASEKTEWHPS
jgi:hypothetical protein